VNIRNAGNAHMNKKGDFALNTIFLEWMMFEIDNVNLMDVGNTHSLIMWLKIREILLHTQNFWNG